MSYTSSSLVFVIYKQLERLRARGGSLNRPRHVKPGENYLALAFFRERAALSRLSAARKLPLIRAPEHPL